MFKLYSQPNCPNCEQLKDYLKTREIDFEEFDVSKDHAAKAFMIMNDLEETPAIIVYGNIISGELDYIISEIDKFY